MMKNKRIIRIGLGLATALIIYMLTIAIVSLLPSKISIETKGNNPEVFNKIAEIETYEEMFTAEHNHLNRIEALFKNPNLESRDELEISLIDNQGLTVASQQFSGFNLGDTSHARMDFSPLTNSEGKKYIIKIETKKINDGMLSFGTKDGHLDFIQYYNQKSGFDLMIKNMSEAINKISKQPVVVILPMVLWILWLW